MIPTAVSQVVEQIVNAIVSVAGAYYLMKWNADSPFKSGWGAAGGTLGACMGAFFALLLCIGSIVRSRTNWSARTTQDSCIPRHIFTVC